MPEMRPDGPRVVALEIGPAVLASRVSAPLGRWVAGLEHALGIDQGRPLRIPIGDILSIDSHIRVTCAFADTPAATMPPSRSWSNHARGTSSKLAVAMMRSYGADAGKPAYPSPVATRAR